MSRAEGLDHVGIVGRDLATLADGFERLGFCLTPLARHAGGRTGNRCVMLGNAYLELMATVDGGTSATLDRFLARHAGIHILAFGIADEAAAAARLRRAGIAVGDPTLTDRAVDESDPTGKRARFVLVTPPDPPEGRIHLIRHLTPDALWQDRFLRHPNHAMSLDEVILVAEQPAQTAARASLYAGRPVTPDPLGGYRLDMPRNRLRILPPESPEAVLPGAAPAAPPCIAGLVLRTGDGAAALRRLLDDRAIPYRMDSAAVVVETGGVTLRFATGTA